jgi:hypothetical protein
VTALVLNLPAESATAQACGESWQLSDEFGASTVEMLHAVWQELRALRGDKSVKGEKRLRIPRPWRDAPKPTRDSEQIKRFFGG